MLGWKGRCWQGQEHGMEEGGRVERRSERGWKEKVKRGEWKGWKGRKVKEE